MVVKPPGRQAIEASPPMKAGDAPPAPSRRSLVRSIGLMVVAALPPWISGVRRPPEIIVVDGWILADTDLR
jgi:hypothetical protein